MAHREEDLKLSNGQTMWVSAFTGRVVSEQPAGDTHEVWIGDGGEEIALTVRAAGWNVRAGQHVTVISGAGMGLERGAPFVAIDHDEGSTHFLGDALPDGVGTNDLPSWGRAALAASVGQLLLLAASALPQLYLPRISVAGWLVTFAAWGVCDLLLTHRARRASLLHEVRRKSVAAITGARPGARRRGPALDQGLAPTR